MSNSLNFRMAISNGEEANNGNTEVDNVVSNGLFFVNWWGVRQNLKIFAKSLGRGNDVIKFPLHLQLFSGEA